MKRRTYTRSRNRQNLSLPSGRPCRQSRKITGPPGDSKNPARLPASAQPPGDFFRPPGGLCDLATVYRAIHLLEEMDMVQWFDFGDGAARFELVREGEAGHHHRLVCTKCSEVVEVEECFPAEAEERVAA